MFKKKNKTEISENDIDKSEKIKTENEIELQEKQEIMENETDEKKEDQKFHSDENSETKIDKIEKKITKLDERLQSIETTINKQAEKNNSLQLLLDNVHEERTKYRDNFFTDKFQKPLITDLIQLHDNITTRIFATEMEETKKELNFVKQNLLNILERLNVETYDNYFEPDEYPHKRNLKLHKVIELVDNDNPEKNNFVSEILKEGFMWDDKVIRPQNVKIYK